MDTIGTIIVASLAGAIPGILTAVVTSFFCSFFNPYSLYYVLIGVLIAMCVSSFVRKEKYKKKATSVLLIMLLAFIGGGIGTCFQWLLLGGPQFDDVAQSARIMAGSSNVGYFISSMFLNIVLNLLDKTASILIAVLIIRFLPKDTIKEIWFSSWKQNPLTNEEVDDINRQSGKGGIHSLRIRIIVLLTFATVTLTIVMATISINLQFENTRQEYTINAINAAKFAASEVDADMINEYLENGRDASGYKETLEMLEKIRDNANGVEYLYVVKIRQDGCYFVFDVDNPEANVMGNEPGTRVEVEEAFQDQMDALIKGEEIEPIESNDTFGWLLTAYYPVRDSKGRTVAYAGADVSMSYLTGYVREFARKALMVFSGFFIMILGYGLWVSGHYLIYPIGSMAHSVEAFMIGSDDQEHLDENVRKLGNLGINTGDEVEKLYKAMCGMARSTAEQLREIRYYADATAKMQNGLIITMADMVENRDSDTGAHIQKTAAYVRIILEGLKKHGYYVEKLTDKYIADVEMSAPLHDVGKINISDAILNKPGKLTDEEFAIMKTHTTAGKKIMEQAISTVNGENYLKEARNMAAYHHERWDGKGYPEGLKGQTIPLSARVMAVADVFDALTSPRVYKPAFPIEKALEILEEGAGAHFDPKCVEVFMDSLPQVKLVLKKYHDIG
jgi:response regulator RpfG family c-di-GMP phosphodiesterase